MSWSKLRCRQRSQRTFISQLDLLYLHHLTLDLTSLHQNIRQTFTGRPLCYLAPSRISLPRKLRREAYDGRTSRLHGFTSAAYGRPSPPSKRDDSTIEEFVNDLNLIKDISIRDRPEVPCFVSQDKERKKDSINGQIGRLLEEQETHPPMSRTVPGHCQRRYFFGEKSHKTWSLSHAHGVQSEKTTLKLRARRMNLLRRPGIFLATDSECGQGFTSPSREFIHQPFLANDNLYATYATLNHHWKNNLDIYPSPPTTIKISLTLIELIRTSTSPFPSTSTKRSQLQIRRVLSTIDSPDPFLPAQSEFIQNSLTIP